jgi:hypothetical protein
VSSRNVDKRSHWGAAKLGNQLPTYLSCVCVCVCVCLCVCVVMWTFFVLVFLHVFAFVFFDDVYARVCVCGAYQLSYHSFSTKNILKTDQK